jgi:hypothetical protein
MHVAAGEDAIIALKTLYAAGAVTSVASGPYTMENQLAGASAVLQEALQMDGVESPSAVVDRFERAVDRAIEPLKTMANSRK